MCPTQLLISPKLKHKVDKYVKQVSIVNAVLFVKTSIGRIEMIYMINVAPISMVLHNDHAMVADEYNGLVNLSSLHILNSETKRHSFAVFLDN